MTTLCEWGLSEGGVRAYRAEGNPSKWLRLVMKMGVEDGREKKRRRRCQMRGIEGDHVAHRGMSQQRRG